MGFRHGATMENFPDVVLSNIFIRLQAKHLARMSTHPSRSPHLEITDFIKLPVNPQSGNSRGKVIGSVNGLICFTYGPNHDLEVRENHHKEVIYGSNLDPDVIYIWNPSLSSLLTVPPYNIPSHLIQLFLRFGYDPKTDDFKVVKVTRRFEPQTELLDKITNEEWLPVEVYSMRKGSWNLITQEIPSNVTDLFDCDMLCVDGRDGHLHWVAEINHFWNAVETTLAFDLGTETFREIPFPTSVPDSILDGNVDDISMDLAILAGSFVWYQRPSQIMNVRGGFALYDPGEAKTKIFKNQGEKYRYGVSKVVEYVDSLVWVTPAEQCEMSCCSISRFQF
ncbi:hypothetical protein LXL04_004265 [Taraxacum kok-saghyz]